MSYQKISFRPIRKGELADPGTTTALTFHGSGNMDTVLHLTGDELAALLEAGERYLVDPKAIVQRTPGAER